jgi:hypothetical protein
MKQSDYDYIIVESFIPSNTSGRHGQIHIRPVSGQDPYQKDLFVECSKALSSNYPVGTKFRIKAKLTRRKGGKEFIYSNYTWSYEVLK